MKRTLILLIILANSTLSWGGNPVNPAHPAGGLRQQTASPLSVNALQGSPTLGRQPVSALNQTQQQRDQAKRGLASGSGQIRLPGSGR